MYVLVACSDICDIDIAVIVCSWYWYQLNLEQDWVDIFSVRLIHHAWHCNYRCVIEFSILKFSWWCQINLYRIEQTLPLIWWCCSLAKQLASAFSSLNVGPLLARGLHTKHESEILERLQCTEEVWQYFSFYLSKYRTLMDTL